MQIQIDTDHNIEGGEAPSAYALEKLRDESKHRTDPPPVEPGALVQP